MSEKKYAIIRVDHRCPQEFEKIDIEYICRNNKCFQSFEGCRRRSKIFYGDTKKQMILKVAQILFQESPHHVLYTNPDKTVNEFFYNDCLKTATKIIEFLGVK